jgi:hypothetical protein
LDPEFPIDYMVVIMNHPPVITINSWYKPFPNGGFFFSSREHGLNNSLAIEEPLCPPVILRPTGGDFEERLPVDSWMVHVTHVALDGSKLGTPTID